MRNLRHVFTILIVSYSLLNPEIGYGSNVKPYQSVLTIGISNIFPISHFPNHDEQLLLKIRENGGDFVYSKIIYVTTVEVTISDHEDYLRPGNEYIFEIVSLKTESTLYTSEYFTYWPDCEPPKNPHAQFEEGKLMVSWDFQDGDNNNHYVIKVSDAVGNILSEVATSPGETSILLNDFNQISGNNIYVQRVCNYSNGINLYSEWFDIDTEGNGDTRSVDCASVQGYTFSVNPADISETSIKVGVSPSPGPGAFYKAYYKVDGTDNWEYLHFNGSSIVTIDNLTPSTKYNIVVYVTVGLNQYEAQSCELLQTVQDHTTLGPSAWLDVHCGADTSFQIDNNDTPVNPDSIFNGRIIIGGGFPLLVGDLTRVGNLYSGFAEVKLPFNGKQLLVELEDAFINVNYVIRSGSISAVDNMERRDQLNLLLQNQPPGEFSCEPPAKDPNEFDPVTGLNGYGFNSSGKYKNPPYEGYVEGDPYDDNYDPNGFGADGNHKNTGTPFDENGCDRTGMDANGNPCVPWPKNPPYYWLDNTPNATEEGKAFWNANQTEIDLALKQAVNELFTHFDDLATEKRSNCDAIRALMDGVVQDKNLDREFLFGENDEYFSEGMYKKFTSPPLEFSNFSGRDEQIINLEKHHFNLYGCDKLLDVYKEVIKIINLYKVNPGDTPPFNLNETSKGELKAYLEPLIKSMSQDGISNNLDTPEKRKNWIFEELYKLVAKEYLDQLEGIGGMFYHRESKFEPVLTPRSNPNSKIPSWKYGFNGVGCSADVHYNGIDMVEAQLLLDQYLPEDGSNGEREIQKILNNHISLFSSGNQELGQPVELTKTTQGQALTIYLDNIRILPNVGNAKLDAFFILQVQSGKRIVFSVNDIEFNRGGISGSIKMALENDITFSIGKSMRMHLLGGAEPTYVVWSCGGLDSIVVNADLEFCREYVVPLNPNTLEPLPDGYVTASISLSMTGWSDMLLQLDVTPFAITGREEYKFQLNSAWIDLSDHRNPTNIQHPLNYKHPLKDSVRWQGVFIDELSITFPSFASGDNGPDQTVGIHNFIIDKDGVSGSLGVNNLLSLETGSIGGWAFSIDSFSLVVNENRFSAGFMEGLIHVPLVRKKDNNGSIKNDDCFNYKANMDAYGKFLFKIGIESDLVVPMLVADVTLDTNSTVTMFSNANGEFEVIATLHGAVDIDLNQGGVEFQTGVIDFDNVALSNRGAAIRNIGNWKFPLIPIRLLGFELNFKHIGLIKSEDDPEEIELRVDTYLALTTAEVALKVDFEFGLIGRLGSEGNHSLWKYDDFKFYEATLSGSGMGITKIEGGLKVFENDPNYGTGWRGSVKVTFDKIPTQVGAVALFGRKVDDDGQTTFKYFMVDAMVIFGTSVPLVPPLNMEGIGGGFWYNMISSNHENVSLSELEVPTTEQVSSQPLGYSLSNVVYTPSNGRIGLKFATVFSIGNPDACNGNIALSVTFNDKFGIAKIGLEGAIRVMGDMNIAGKPVNGQGDPGDIAPVRAYFSMEMDFKNTTFSANYETYLNVGGVLVGDKDHPIPTRRFGRADMYFSDEEWYVWVGTPESPTKLKIVAGDISFGNISTYFVMGNALPKPPILKDELAQFFGVSPTFVLDQRMKTGGGFMHGAHLTIGDEYNFWIFSLTAKFQVGYDMVVMKYDAYCGHNGPKPGFDGWYAQGQVYAYLHAEIGYKVKVLGRTRTGKIAALEAGMLLRASLPNPIHAQGVVAIRYNILGVLKGNKRYNFTLGTKCDLVDGEGEAYTTEWEIIESISPDQGTMNVPCDQAISINMMMPHMTKLEVEEDKWIFALDRYTFTEAGSTRSVSFFNPQWSEDSVSLLLKPRHYLLPDRTYKVMAIGSATKNGSAPQLDTAIVTFSTGVCSQVIDVSNIAESYPHIGQHHFFVEEMDAEHGYVKLVSGQNYIFSSIPINAHNIVRVKIADTGEEVHQGSFWNNCFERQLNFRIPWKDFAQPSTSYKIEFVQAFKPLPPNDEPDIDAIDKDGSEEVTRVANAPNVPGFPPPVTGPGFPTSPCTPQIEENPLVVEHIFLEYHFKTSAYTNAKSKWDALFDPNEQNVIVALEEGGLVQKIIINGEGFDEYEIEGVNGISPFYSNFSIAGSSWLNPHQHYLEIRTLPGGIQLNPFDPPLFTSMKYDDIADPLVETIRIDTLVRTNGNQFSGFVDHYNHIVFKSILPKLVKDETYDINLRISNYFEEIGSCTEFDCYNFPFCTLTELIECSGSDHQILEDLIDNKLPYHFPINGDTKLKIDYNSKPLTNKGMTPINLLIPETQN